MKSLPKKKILLITGAGASLGFGMPSTNDIDDLFDKWSAEICTVEGSSLSLYSYLKKEMNHFYASLSIKRNINFEDMLYMAMQLASLGRNYSPNALNAFINLKELPELCQFSRPVSHEQIGFAFSNMVRHLTDKLVKHFREKCLLVQREYQDDFSVFKIFLHNLANDFELGVVTLNYDDVVLQAMNNLNTGFSLSGDFDPHRIIVSDKWNFCYHLHGSVHFDMVGSRIDMHQIKWNEDLGSKFQQNSGGRNPQSTKEDIDVITSTIIAGYNKKNQIYRYPFSLYYADFVRKANEADGFIFAGYGFPDIHLNEAINESLKINRKRPVVIIDYADNNEDPMQFRSDDWSNNLFKTIPVNGHEIALKGHSSPTPISELKKENLMEHSNNPKYPLALWYNGLLGICKHYDLVKDALSAV